MQNPLNSYLHNMDVQYLHVYSGHSRDQFEDHKNNQMTHHNDRWMYQELLHTKCIYIFFKYGIIVSNI